MLRSCWQCLGAMRWTLPKWGLQCGTFAQRSPFIGPVEQRVSRGSYGERPGLPWTFWERERNSLGFIKALPHRAPEAAADLSMHRHLLPKQHLCVSLLLLPPRLNPQPIQPHKPASWTALSSVPWKAAQQGLINPSTWP